MKAKHTAEIRELERRPFVSLLDQTKWWKSNDGWVRRKKMTNAHKLAVLAWLERNARNLITSREAYTMRALLAFPDDPSDGVFAAMTGIEKEHDLDLEAICAEDDSQVLELIRETDMYQALLEDVVRDAGVFTY